MTKRIIFPDRYQNLATPAAPVVLVPNFLSPTECERVRKLVGNNTGGEFLAGETGIMVSTYAALDPEAERALTLKLFNAVRKANRGNFKFSDDLFMNKGAYVNRYCAESADFRGWHVDLGDGREKDRLHKLSAVVQLSRPEEYQGGELEFMSYHNPNGAAHELKMQQGTLIVYPAYEFHRVSKMLGGTRYSLIMFVCGTPFK